MANQPNEKRQNFVRLADKRVGVILGKLAQLSKLSNRGSYEYSENDVKIIVAAIQAGLDGVSSSFANALAGKKDDNAKAFSVLE